MWKYTEGVNMAYAAAAMAGLQLAGGYFASQNVRAAAETNRRIADINKEFAELDAFDARADGQTAAAEHQAVIDQTLSEQNAILAAQGVDTSFGSAASIQTETRATAESNLMEIEKRAQQKALGYEQQGRDYISQGVMQQGQANAKAGQIMFNSVMSAAQTGITGYEKYQARKVK